MMDNTISDYEMYLFWSYVPRFSEAGMDWFNCDFDNNFGGGVGDESWWVDEGVKAWKQTAAEELADTATDAVHVVPLSAGLDSRVILGALLENLPRSQIVTATYGIPGTWDFDIAKKIARKFGLRHEAFNLLDEKWDLDQLAVAATRLKKPISVHQSYVRQKITNHFGADCVYWSGFMGDALSGVDLPVIPNTDKRKAIKRHIDIEAMPDYRDQKLQSAMIEKMLLELPWDRLQQSKFTLDQQLILGLWQKQITRYIAVIDGFVFKTPFLNKTWVNFITKVPYKWLIDKYLYMKIIRKGYNELSKFGTTDTAGMSLFHNSRYEVFLGKAIARLKPYMSFGNSYRSHPRTNYINWTETLRHKGGLQDSVYTTLQDLKKRSIFDEKQLDDWWMNHLNRKMDHTRLLMNLSSLELLLKAGVMVQVA
jgi:hypothetical protein